MEAQKPNSEDLFEAARNAFFGTGRTTPTSKESLGVPVKLRDKLSEENVSPANSSDDHA
jgi:hypothetical protein